MSLSDLIVATVYIALMELADKTMIATSILACSTRKPYKALIISVLAFSASCFLVVLLSYTFKIIFNAYMNLVRVASALIFIFLALILLKSMNYLKEEYHSEFVSKSLIGLFIAIFMAELGDKTQLTMLALSLKYSVIPVLIGGIIGYTIVNSFGVTLSYSIAKRINLKYIIVICSIIMLATGIGILLNLW